MARYPRNTHSVAVAVAESNRNAGGTDTINNAGNVSVGITDGLHYTWRLAEPNHFAVESFRFAKERRASGTAQAAGKGRSAKRGLSADQ